VAEQEFSAMTHAGAVASTDTLVVRGEPYEQRLAAVHLAPPVAWRLAAGDLPPGLNLDADGLLWGTVPDGPAGGHAVTVEARGRGGQPCTAELVVRTVPRALRCWAVDAHTLAQLAVGVKVI
jgi:hypothetical protein